MRQQHDGHAGDSALLQGSAASQTADFLQSGVNVLMRGSRKFAGCVFLFVLAAVVSVKGQEMLDRIVARLENDIILQSDVRELKAYQELLDGKSESEDAILDRLIDQWIVRSEAELSRFPEPKDTEIEQAITRVVNSFGSAEEYETRRKQVGLSDSEVRKIVAAQLYLSSYLDSRFRPSAQIDEKAIVDFYQNAVVPKAKARGQEAPTLDDARDIIQEALVQSDINDQADRWLKESRARLHVQKFLEAGTK